MSVPAILLVGVLRLEFPGRFGQTRSASMPLWPEAAAGASTPARRGTR
jgi:hypothetical protein